MREITLNKEGYRTVWRNGPKGERTIQVDVFKEDKLVLEWEFPKIGGNALNGNAAIFLEQVIIYAKDHEAKK